MSTIRQSICFGCFNRGGLTPESLIREAARMGYASVEMLPEEHWNRVRDAGMVIAIVVGHASLPDGLNKRENHDRIEDELLANMDQAVEYGIPGLICFSGNREASPTTKAATTASRACYASRRPPRSRVSPCAWNCSTAR